MKKVYPAALQRRYRWLVSIFLLVCTVLCFFRHDVLARITEGLHKNYPVADTSHLAVHTLDSANPSGKNVKPSFSKHLSFLENKGQVVDQNGSSRRDIDFALPAAPGLNIFIGNGTLHYQFSKAISRKKESTDKYSDLLTLDSLAADSVSMYRMDVELVGANPKAKPEALDPQSYYERYYTATVAERGAVAHSFNRIVYKDIYPHIDWVLYTRSGKLKHEFHVHTGGRVSDIKLKYGGATKLAIDKTGALTATTPMGDIVEQAPVSYTSVGESVATTFTLQGQTISYSVRAYQGDLVIDPTLDWATYFGGPNTNRAFGLAAGKNGSTIAVGYTGSTSGVATTGSYQSILGGNLDGYIAKFSCGGGLLWSTYFGGPLSDIINDICCDTSGCIGVCGSTKSSSGIATSGAWRNYITTPGGMAPTSACFLARFYSDGAIDWATYFGGIQNDEARAIACNTKGDLFITGRTQSDTGIATTGAFQTTFSGSFDMFLAKFTREGQRAWATYLGGTGLDQGRDLTIGESDHVYAVGMVSSAGLGTPGTFRELRPYPISVDILISKFDSSGGRVWSSYFGGGFGEDLPGIAYASGALYVTAATLSPTDISTPGAFKDTISGLSDIAFAKFTTTGQLLWSTYVGGSDDDEGILAVSPHYPGSVFIAGRTGSDAIIPLSGAYQDTAGGGNDAFLLQFDTSGQPFWGTFFGGAGDEHAVCMCIDDMGNPAFAGISDSVGGMATWGAYMEEPGDHFSSLIVKFDFQLAPIIDSISPIHAHTAQLVTIFGKHFNTTASKNIVHFGATQAMVNYASDTLLVVAVPIGATFEAVTVLNATNGRMGLAPKSFLPTYDNSPYEPGVINFDTAVNFLPSTDTTSFVYISDLDGDGKADIIARRITTGIVSNVSNLLFRNTSTAGVIDSGSFASPVTVSVPSLSTSNGFAIADIDGDGLKDLVGSVSNGADDNFIYILRNKSNPGTFSFDSAVFLPVDNVSDITCDDIDGDGRTEIIVAGYDTVFLIKNRCYPGNIHATSFAAPVGFACGSSNVATGDLDGDGRRDIVTTRYTGAPSYISIFRNNAVNGAIATSSLASPVLIPASGDLLHDLALEDIDGDGKPEILINHSDGTIRRLSVYKNNYTPGTPLSSVSFSAVQLFSLPSHSVSSPNLRLADVDGDAGPDIISLSSMTGAVCIKRNSSTAGSIDSSSFSAPVFISGQIVAGCPAAGDMDGDGLPDICVSATHTPLGHARKLLVLRNNPLRRLGGIRVCPGDVTTLTSNVRGGTWSSADPSVATIDPGTGALFAVGPGTASITYTINTGFTSAIVTVDAALCGGPGIITTVAGSGAGPVTGIGGPAINAQIGNAKATAKDNDGNVYIANDGSRIFKVTTDGILHAFAGTGLPGYTGDGSSATAATIGTVSHIAVDGPGNLYFTDQAYHCIRKVSHSGIITTIAGNGSPGFSADGTPATASQLTFPSGLAIDNSARIFFRESKRIRMIDPYAANTVLTVAGDGTCPAGGDGGAATAAAICDGTGIAVDPSGRIALAAPASIRQVDHLGFISTIAGTGANGFAGDGGPATAAQLDMPDGLAYHAAGELLMADQFNSRIRKFLPGGNIETLAGNGSFAFNGDGCPATATSLNQPADVFVDAWGKVYIADYDNYRVRVISGNHLAQFAQGASQSLTVASGIIAMLDTALSVTDGDNQQPLTWSVLSGPASGTLSVSGTQPGNGGTCYPVGFSYTPAGGFSGYDSFTVRVVDCAGADDTTTVYVTVTGDVPIVYSVFPNPAKPGDLVTISGLNFNPLASLDIVYFGATRAAVSMASTDTIIATVPIGATYHSVSVTNIANGLTGSSPLQFLPTYDNSLFVPGVVNFDPQFTLAAGTQPYDVCIGDVDGDGKPDVVASRLVSSAKLGIIIFRNTSSLGTIDASSFAAPITLRLAPYSSDPHQLLIRDMDGDGKVEIITTGALASSVVVSVFPNQATPGHIDSTSFASRVDIPLSLTNYQALTIDDFDGDGKPDIACLTKNIGDDSLLVLRNNCIPGTLDAGMFTRASIFHVDGARALNAIDINGDRKSDLVVTRTERSKVTAFQNTSTGTAPDAISFSTPVDFLLGTPSSFLSLHIPNVPMGDLNADNKPDIVVPDVYGNVISLLNNNSTTTIDAGSFSPPVQYAVSPRPVGLAITDVNGDGLPDISVTNNFSKTVQFFLNTGMAGTITTSSFTLAGGFPIDTLAFRLAVGDLDGDNFPDAIVARLPYSAANASISILRNNPLRYITGTPAVCVGATTTLVNGTQFGKWQSSNSAIASVDSVTGTVTGVAPGTTLISYVVRGGQTSVVFTVDPLPSPGAISGDSVLCVASSLPLTNAAPGGVWSVSAPLVGAIDVSGTFTGLHGGTAIVSYTVTNSCGSASALHAMTVNPLPDTGTLEGSSMICLGASVLFSDTTHGGTWSSTNPSVVSIDAAGLATGLAAGTAIISYATTNGCGTLAATRLVTVTPVPDAGVISGPATVCVAGLTTLSSSAPGGTWSSTMPSRAVINSLGRVVGLSVGTTIISYALNNGCGIAYTSRLLTVVTPGVAAVSGPSYVCTGTDITLSCATAGGTWSSPSTNIAVDSASGMINGLSAGTAVVTYGVVNGCGTFIATKTVTVYQSPYAGLLTGLGSVCVGSSVVFYNAVPGGTWASSNSGAATVIAPGIVSGVGAGTASISYTVSNVCGANVATKVVTVIPLPDAGVISGMVTLCPGATTFLSSSIAGGTWSSGNASVAVVNSGGLVSGVTPGTATISYHVASVCGTDISAMVVTVSPYPSAGAISGPSSVCEAADALLSSSVSAGVWSSSAIGVASVSATGVVTGITPGSVYVSYSVTNMCGTAVSSVNVAVMPLPVAGAITGSPSVCAGAFTILSVSSFGGTWSSSAPLIASVSAAGQASGNNAGTCVVSYTVTNGCGTAVATHPFTVNPLSPAGFIVGPATICLGNTVSFTDAVPGGLWSSSDTMIAVVNNTGVVSALSLGTALISYTTVNSCGSVSVTKLVSVSPVPAAITGPDSACEGTEFYLSCTTPGGVFTGGTGVASLYNLGGGNARLVAIDPGTVSIRYLKAGCYSEKVVTVLPLPAVGPVSGAPVACPGSIVTFSVSATGGTWVSSNPSVMAIDAAGIATALSAGTSSVSYSVINSCGTASVSQIITVYPVPDHGTISGPDVVCAGGGTVLLVHTGAGSVWSSSNASVATVTAPGVVTGVNAGVVTISYTVSNMCGTVFATKQVTVQPLPDAGILAGTTAVCQGSTTTFTSTTPGGAWISENPAVAAVDLSTGIVTGVTPGAVYISYTAGNACGASTRRRVVTVNPLPEAGLITGTTTLCVGGVTYLAHAPYAGSWSSGNTTVAGISVAGIVTGHAAGIAAISYTVSNSCGTDISTVQVTVNTLPVAGVSPATITLCPGEEGLLVPATPSGTWTSSDATIVAVTPSGGVTAIGSGTAIVSYRVSNVCGTVSSATVVTVLSTPNAGAILGLSSVCAGSTGLLVDPVGGGAWSTSSPAVATIGTDGVLSGIGVGTATISYLVSNTCGSAVAIRTVTVNPAPGPVSGPIELCAGASATFSCGSAGGNWSASGPLSINAYGTASAAGAGGSVVSYTLPGGCFSILPVSVYVQPAGIMGALSLCEGSDHALIPVPADASGTWTSTGAANVAFSGWLVSGLSPGTATVSYTTSHGCSLSAVVTVEPRPQPISGPGDLCEGVSSLYSSATLGGAWVSNNPPVLSIGLTSGVAYTAAPGTATVSYTLGACSSHLVVTVNKNPAPIAGSLGVCVGATTFLDNIRHGGAWASADPAVADFVYPSGELRGTTPGTVTISYSIGSCAVTAIATVNPLPQPILGDSVICNGAMGALVSATPGGTWIGGGTINVQSLSGLFEGVAAGTTTVSYLLPTGCISTKTITVDPLPGAIVGNLVMCRDESNYLSAFGAGSWSSSSVSVAAVDPGTGRVAAIAPGTAVITYSMASGCSSVAVVTVHPFAASIDVAHELCMGTSSPLTGMPSGGTWQIDRPGIAQISMGSTVDAISPGVAIVSYWLHPSCPIFDTVKVHALPGPVTGRLSVCENEKANIYCAPSGGTWSSSGSVLDITSAGEVTGLVAGTARVTYTSVAGCSRSAIVTVNPLPAPISGPGEICEGRTAIYSSVTSGGTWEVSSPGVVAIDAASGQLTGLSAGSSLVSYKLGTGCYATANIAVFVSPAPIVGPGDVCEGASVKMTNATWGGTWSSVGDALTVDAFGVVTGQAPGVGTVAYTMPNACAVITTLRVDATPQTPVITGNSTACIGDTMQLHATPLGGAWMTSEPSVLLHIADGKFVGMLPAKAPIYYEVENACGITIVSVTALVQHMPWAGNITGPLSVCLGETGHYASSSENGYWLSMRQQIGTILGSGEFYPSMPGTALIAYVVTNSCGADTATFTIPVRGANDCDSTRRIVADFNLYPNPSRGAFIFESPVAGTLAIYAADGKRVGSYAIAGWVTPISLPVALQKGVYLCSFIGYEGSTFVAKLVITP